MGTSVEAVGRLGISYSNLILPRKAQICQRKSRPKYGKSILQAGLLPLPPGPHTQNCEIGATTSAQKYDVPGEESLRATSVHFLSPGSVAHTFATPAAVNIFML